MLEGEDLTSGGMKITHLKKRDQVSFCAFYFRLSVSIYTAGFRIYYYLILWCKMPFKKVATPVCEIILIPIHVSE